MTDIKFKYRAVNKSEIEKAGVDIITYFNMIGGEGWEYVRPMTSGSFLFKKRYV